MPPNKEQRPGPSDLEHSRAPTVDPDRRGRSSAPGSQSPSLRHSPGGTAGGLLRARPTQHGPHRDRGTRHPRPSAPGHAHHPHHPPGRRPGLPRTRRLQIAFGPDTALLYDLILPGSDRAANAASAGTAPTGPVPTLGAAGWRPGTTGYGQVRPSEANAGGDGTSVVIDLRWKSWGGPTASATGIASWVPPEGSFADGVETPAIVTASDLGPCQGHLAYRKITWYFPSRGDTPPPARSPATPTSARRSDTQQDKAAVADRTRDVSGRGRPWPREGSGGQDPAVALRPATRMIRLVQLDCAGRAGPGTGALDRADCHRAWTRRQPCGRPAGTVSLRQGP